MKKIDVLIVDDSMLFRTAVSKGFSEDSVLNVVGCAGSAEDAWLKILHNKPDVMTLDIEMPGMNGLEFLRKFLPMVYIPVVVVSAVNGVVFEALRAGAVDFVPKPSGNIGYAEFVQDLKTKVKVAAATERGKNIGTTLKRTQTVNAAAAEALKNSTAASAASTLKSLKSLDTSMLPSKPEMPTQPIKLDLPSLKGPVDIIALGASTGGTEATAYILRNLPNTLPGIVITQHMPPVFTKLYAERLNRECAMSVKEAQSGDVVERGWAYVAPGDMQMRVVKHQGRFVIQCEPGPKVSGHCPSVDVLFESVSKIAGTNSIGIILTGMGADGANGLVMMKNAGAFTLGQDQKSCVVYGMPMEAFKRGGVVKQASLDIMPNALMQYLKIKP